MNNGAVVRGGIKLVALAVGFVATAICLMAVVGRFTENGWARSLGALVLTVLVPAVVVDRLLPKDPTEKAGGMPSDVFALAWVAFPAVFAVALGSFTQRLLASEGDRLTSSGWPNLAWVSYRLGGLQAVAPEAPPPAASASAAVGDEAPSAAAVPAPSDVPSAAPSAGPAPSATPKPAPGTEVNAAELFKKLAPAVVTLSIKGSRSEGGGTGFLIDSAGTVVTNHHVIEDAVGCTVKTLSGATYEDVWLLSDEAASDLALLKIDLQKPKEGTPPDFAPVVLGDSNEVQVGEPVFVIGNPLGLEHTLTTGIVSARRTYEGKKWIQMSAPISPGNSGGPVFDGKGKVIGVATAVIHGYGRAQNLNLAVPVDQVKQLIKSDYPNKRKLGSGGGTGGSW